jgi:hypothetical protein
MGDLAACQDPHLVPTYFAWFTDKFIHIRMFIDRSRLQASDFRRYSLSMTFVILPFVALIFVLGIPFQYIARRKKILVGITIHGCEAYL